MLCDKNYEARLFSKNTPTNTPSTGVMRDSPILRLKELVGYLDDSPYPFHHLKDMQNSENSQEGQHHPRQNGTLDWQPINYCESLLLHH